MSQIRVNTVDVADGWVKIKLCENRRFLGVIRMLGVYINVGRTGTRNHKTTLTTVQMGWSP